MSVASVTDNDEFKDRLRFIKARIRAAWDETARRYPEPTPAMKKAGCIEVVWANVTHRAAEAEASLDEAMIMYAEGRAPLGAVEDIWRVYVKALMRHWSGNSPHPL